MRTLLATAAARVVLCAAISAAVCGSLAAQESEPRTEGNRQQVWRWVDKEGVMHFSDRPVPGAVPVNVTPQTVELEPAVAPPPRSQPPRQSNADYRAIVIAKPSNDEAIFGTGGQLSVSIRIDPGLQAGHSVRLEMDGRLVSPVGATQLDYSFNDVDRGTHTLTATIVGNNQVLLQSAPVTFHMKTPVAR
jgi:hypothetical protein